MTQQTETLETLGRSIEIAQTTWHDIATAAKMSYRQRSVSKALVALCASGHAEKTPSLWLYPSNTFVCYGCSWHGRMQHFIVQQTIMKPTSLLEELEIDIPHDILPNVDLYYDEYLKRQEWYHDIGRNWPDEPF